MRTVTNKSSVSIKSLTVVALMTAVTCVLGPISIPIGVIPISLTNFAIYLAVILLGWKKGTMSLCIYLLIGMIGIPVFSNFSGGIGKLLGPTGGFLIGFIFMALISGWFVEQFPGKKQWYLIGMVLGTLVAYLFGSVWLSYQANLTLSAAMMAGVVPFIPGDLLKIVIAIFVGTNIKKRISSI